MAAKPKRAQAAGHMGQLHLPPITATKTDKYRLQRASDYNQFKGPSVVSLQPIKTTHRVEKTLQRLNECLSQLGSSTSDGGSIDTIQLERIKVCSLIFSDIVRDSGHFQPQLAHIKKAYDCRLDALLKTLPSDSANLHPHTTAMGASPNSYDQHEELSIVKQQVALLEQEARELLKENERLNNKMAEEMRQLSDRKSTTSTPAKEEQRSSPGHSSESDFAAQVEKLHLQLWQCKKDINDSLDKRKGQVPVDVNNHLEQCIRSTELQIQRYRKQNKKLKDEIQALEGELHRYLEVCRVPRDEIMSLWTSLEQNAVKFAKQGQNDLQVLT